MKANGNSQIEKRLARLEAELEQLRAEVQQCKQSGWRSVVGGHRGSQTFEEIARAIRRHRREDYAKAAGTRPRPRSTPKAALIEE